MYLYLRNIKVSRNNYIILILSLEQIIKQIEEIKIHYFERAFIHQQNHIGAAIFIKHFQKHYINQLSSIEDDKMKNRDGAGCEFDKQQSKQDASVTQNASQISANYSICKFDLSKESLIKSFQHNNVSQAEFYENSDYNINQMTESQLKYANSIMEKIKNPKSD